MKARKPIEIDGNMLRAIFTEQPQRSDTRGFVVRLVSSLKVTVRGSLSKGIKFIGIRGNADF